MRNKIPPILRRRHFAMIVTFLVMIFSMSGCNRLSQNPSYTSTVVVTNQIPSPIITESISVSPTTEVTKTPAPISENTNPDCISRVRMIAEDSQFSLWAHDQDTLYFSDKFEKIWQAYDARTEAARDLTEDEIAYVQRAIARRRLQHQQAIGEETDWDDLFVSPDTQIVVYLKIEDLDLPSGTQIPNGSRNLNHLIYLARGGESPAYIGKVEGLIADAYWSVSTSTVIFAMQEVGLSIGKRSPYHVWTLNYKDLTISKFFMRNEQEENILIQAITSDGSSVFYRSSDLEGQFLQEYNLFDGTNQILSVPSSTSYIWTLDNNSLILLAQEQEGSDQVYIFDLENHQLKAVDHLPFAAYRFSNDVADISASRQYLSFSPGQGKLMILRLCSSK